MNKIVAAITEKKIKDTTAAVSRTAAAVAKAAEESITMSRKMFGLEIAVALLGGIVIGMFLSPRKKVTYKIASNNRINADDDDEKEEDESRSGNDDEDGNEYYDDDDDDDDDDADDDDDDDSSDNNSKFIKL